MTELPDLREFLVLLRETCRYLLQCGCSSNRVETIAQKLGDSWSFEVETIAIPTGVWLSVRRGDAHLVELTRVRSQSVDLDRLARLNLLVESMSSHRISITDALRMIQREGHSVPPYNKFITLVAGGGSSPVLIYSYGGSALECGLALPIGVIVQWLSKYAMDGDDTRRYLSDVVAGAAVALYACLCQRIFPAVDVPRMVVGGLVALVPGLVLVNAVHEVAQKNLVSGAAKLLEALVITASLGCGVAFVLGLVYSLT